MGIIDLKKEFSIVATLPLTDGSFWGLIIGNKINQTEITEFDKIIFQMFLQLLDNACQAFIYQKNEKQLNFSLNHKVVQLNSLIDTGIEISKLRKTSSLLELSLERAATLTNASRGVLQIISGDDIISAIGFPNDSDIKKVFWVTTLLIGWQYKAIKSRGYHLRSMSLYLKAQMRGSILLLVLDYLLAPSIKISTMNMLNIILLLII